MTLTLTFLAALALETADAVNPLGTAWKAVIKILTLHAEQALQSCCELIG